MVHAVGEFPTIGHGIEIQRAERESRWGKFLVHLYGTGFPPFGQFVGDVITKERRAVFDRLDAVLRKEAESWSKELGMVIHMKEPLVSVHGPNWRYSAQFTFR